MDILVEPPTSKLFESTAMPDRDWWQALRDDGIFVVINWWPRPREETAVLGKPRGPRFDLRFSPEQVAAWVEPAGFRLREVKEVGPYHYGAIFAGSAITSLWTQRKTKR